MKYSVIVLLSSLIILSGCAMSSLKEDILNEARKEIKYEANIIKQDIAAERARAEEQIENIKQDVENVKNESRKNISEIKGTHIKDHNALQKQIFDEKLALDDTITRIKLLERISTTNPVPVISNPVTTGFVTYIDGNNIFITLGSENNVKTGDIFGVYHDNNKVATINAEEVDVNSSKCSIISKTEDISIEDKIMAEEK